MKKITTAIIFSFALFSAMPLLANDDLANEKKLVFSKNEFLGIDNFYFQPAQNIVLSPVTLMHSKKRGQEGDKAFAEGKIIISAGYGFGNLNTTLFNVYKTAVDGEYGFKLSTVGPIHFKGEYAISDKIGIGVSVNYISNTATWSAPSSSQPVIYTYKEQFTSLSVLFRMNIHFATTGKVDPYWGIGAGYRSGGWNYTSNDPNSLGVSTPTIIPLGFETTFGLRYYFTDAIGLYTEIGLAKSVIQVGLVIKL